MKKWICLFLCVVMLIQILPISAFAASEQEDIITATYDPFKIKKSPPKKAPSFNTESLKALLSAGLYECETYVDISSLNIPDTQANLDVIVNIMFDELHECFHLKNSYSYSRSNGIITKIYPYYTCTLTEYRAMLAELIAVKEKLVQGIKGNSNLDDVQKALLLHDRLAMICQYDYTYSHIGGTTYGAMVLGSAVCQGYTEAYDYLLEEVGIKGTYCQSDALNHIWNIVYIDDTPYHVDVTWDDYAWNTDERGAEGAVVHDNFLRSSEGIYSTRHYASDYDTTPTSTKYDNYFWQNSHAAFQMIGDELYYIDSSSYSSTHLRRYSDQAELFQVTTYWWMNAEGYIWGNQARLSSDGTYLYYSLPDSVYQYDVSKNVSKKIFAPELEGYTWIYGFQYEDGYLVCDIADGPPYYDERTVLYQIRQAYSAVSDSVIQKWNVSLDSDINLNFYLPVNSSATGVKITTPDKEQTLLLSNLEKVDGFYKISVELAAAQMNDTVSVQVLSSTGNGQATTYSVRQYCDTVLADSTKSAYHRLVKEMLNYGAMAQTLFGYNTGNLANSGISGTGTQAVPSSATDLQISGKLSRCAFYGATLVYRNKIALRYYFSGDVSGLTFTANGKTYTPVAKDGLYYIEIADILPQNLDKQITLTVKDAGSNAFSVTYGPMDYMIRMTKTGSTHTQNLVRALYNYHLAAKAL